MASMFSQPAASVDPAQLGRRTWTAILLCILAALFAGCAPAPPFPTPTQGSRPARAEQDRAKAAQQPVKPSAEVLLDGLMLPAALAFAPDGRLFFVEVSAGRIRVAHGRELQPEPFATLPVQQAAESGLLGLALDPDFSINHFVYAYYSEAHPADPTLGVRNRVVRFTDRAGRGLELTPILDNLPVSPTGAMDAHQGGALVFGSDGALFISTGETGKPTLAQDLSSLAGKILRINRDGSIPADNPDPSSPVFALGLRNPWGLAVHPKNGLLFATDNGNKSHDEVNLVRPGGNYGWPSVEGTARDPRFVDPIWDSGTGTNARNGMVGLAVYSGALFPELEDELLVCSFKSGRIRRMALEPSAYGRVLAVSPLDGECRLGIAVGPDGAIYVSNVNTILRLAR